MTKGEEYSRLYNQGYEQGKSDGAREFAEWLCKWVIPQDNPHVIYSAREMLNDGSSYEVEPSDLLAEWKKGDKK